MTHPFSKVASNDNNVQLIAETVHILGLDFQPSTAWGKMVG